MRKRYIDAQKLVKRRHKKYDTDLSEIETIESFFTPRGLLAHPLSQEPGLSYTSAEIEKETLRAYARGLKSIYRLFLL